VMPQVNTSSILQVYFLVRLAESGSLLFEVAVAVCVQININYYRHIKWLLFEVAVVVCVQINITDASGATILIDNRINFGFNNFFPKF